MLMQPGALMPTPRQQHGADAVGRHGQQQPLCANRCASQRAVGLSLAAQQQPQRSRQEVLRRAAPFNDYNPSDSLDDSRANNSSSSSLPAPPSQQPQQQQPATVPRVLTPAAAQQLEQLLLELLPQPPASTPAAPLLAGLLPLLQPNLSVLPAGALLGVLQLCNAAGHTTSLQASWLQAWTDALHAQLPKLSPQTACSMLAEVLRLRQAALPDGLLDDLFTAVLKDPSSCSSSSLAAVLAAVAAELGHMNGSSSSSSSSSSRSSPPNVTLASWRSGYYSARGGSAGGRSGPDVSGMSQLLPLALHCCVEELGQGNRLAQLQPAQLAAVAAAAVALQLRLPAGWLDRLFDALQQQLPALSGPALALLTASLPQLLPAGGNLRLWRQLGAVVQAQGDRLSAEQLCEVLPLVQAADLPLPVEWLDTAMRKIEAQLPHLGLPQSSRALVAAASLGHSPAQPWVSSYMQRFKAGLSELNPEGLVDVLRALAAADALPSHQWLTEFEQDLERRFGFIGPVELSTTAFLFANLGHIPSEAWRGKFLAEALKFRAYYTGADLTQIVWSTVRLSMQPSQQWLEAFVAQLQEQAGGLQEAYQLAFTLAVLQKLGAPMSAECIDQVLDAYLPALRNASASDTALLLVTVARLRHVSSYSWLQGVLDHCQDNMLAFDGQELVTILWSLAQLHHQPDSEWLSVFVEAAEPHLSSLTGNQLAQLGYSLGQLGVQPPAHFLESFLTQCQVAMAADGMGGRDAAALLAALATLQHTPTEPWLHACLNLLHWKLRELDPEGLAAVATSLVKLGVVISAGPWLDNYISSTSSRLSGMTPETQVNLLSALAVWNAKLSPAWLAMFQLLCVKQAEEGSMSAEQLEQLLVALSTLGATPSSALTQHYYDASLPLVSETSADSIAAVLRALQDAKLQPDVAWLEAVVAAVRANIRHYSILQLNGVAKALTAFEAAGLRKPFLQNFVAYLQEFFLY